MKACNSKYLEWGVAGIGALVLFFFFFKILPYHLFHREQIQLFMFSSETLIQYFERPAALACLMGDFLTQYFYYEGAGPAVLALVLLLWGFIVFRLLIPCIGRWAWLPAVLAVAWEAGRQCGIIYPLSATFALIGGGVIALCFRRYMHKSWKIALLVGLISVAASYYLFGCGVWLTTIFLFSRKNLWIWFLLLAETCALPAMARRSYLFTWSQTYAYPATSWYNIPNLEREHQLRIDCEMYFGRLDRVQAALSEKDQHSSFTTYYYNLLNAQKGQLPYKLMEYYQPASLGLFLPVAPTSTYITIYAANELWFTLGDMTMAEHATILGMIFSPNHTGARAIKRLAEINLINGDEAAAMKYLRLLKKTLCYREWAERRMPGRQTPEVCRWLERKRQLLPATDVLRNSGNVPLSLRHLLRTHSENELALNYLLCYDLLNKDIGAFAKDYQEFAANKVPCRLYAEGLLIYLAGNKAPIDEVKRWRIDPLVLDEFNEYSKLYEAGNGDGTALQAKYGKTYWFYFHYATMKQ